MESDPNDDILNELHAIERLIKGEFVTEGDIPTIIDWEHSFAKEYREDYLVSSFWPIGRSLHVFAEPKTGKSMVALWIGCNIAVGRDAFTGAAIEPQNVYYLDREMTEADVIDRVESMGFGPGDLKRLKYDLYPDIPPLDTQSGGYGLLAKLNQYECDIAVIDTLSRVVKGGENDNDTYRNFHNHTGGLLKAHGKTMMRLDHKGHGNSAHSRGASAKADDVDLVYELSKKDDGQSLTLKRTHARVRGPWETINLAIGDDPVSYKMLGAHAYVNGAREKARELDGIGAPIDISKRAARVLLKAAGVIPGKDTVLMDAIRYRKDQIPGLGEFLK